MKISWWLQKVVTIHNCTLAETKNVINPITFRKMKMQILLISYCVNKIYNKTKKHSRFATIMIITLFKERCRQDFSCFYFKILFSFLSSPRTWHDWSCHSKSQYWRLNQILRFFFHLIKQVPTCIKSTLSIL